MEAVKYSSLGQISYALYEVGGASEKYVVQKKGFGLLGFFLQARALECTNEGACSKNCWMKS
jgi:hypothetical protein